MVKTLLTHKYTLTSNDGAYSMMVGVGDNIMVAGSHEMLRDCDKFYLPLVDHHGNPIGTIGFEKLIEGAFVITELRSVGGSTEKEVHS